jgi:hypothetical protein
LELLPFLEDFQPRWENSFSARSISRLSSRTKAVNAAAGFCAQANSCSELANPRLVPRNIHRQFVFRIEWRSFSRLIAKKLMPISGLILTINPDHPLRAQTFHKIKRRPELMLGELSGCWLPAVTETGTAGESREIHEWLTSLPSIMNVDVVSVDYEDFAALELPAT